MKDRLPSAEGGVHKRRPAGGIEGIYLRSSLKEDRSRLGISLATSKYERRASTTLQVNVGAGVNEQSNGVVGRLTDGQHKRSYAFVAYVHVHGVSKQDRQYLQVVRSSRLM